MGLSPARSRFVQSHSHFLPRPCADLHLAGTRRKDVVCKHWLNNRCRQGDLCTFIHVYDPARFPRCQFWDNSIKETGIGCCVRHTIDECLFLHVAPVVVPKADCELYARGFCHRGARCTKL